jgi:hypothetical protein
VPPGWWLLRAPTAARLDAGRHRGLAAIDDPLPTDIATHGDEGAVLGGPNLRFVAIPASHDHRRDHATS